MYTMLNQEFTVLQLATLDQWIFCYFQLSLCLSMIRLITF